MAASSIGKLLAVAVLLGAGFWYLFGGIAGLAQEQKPQPASAEQAKPKLDRFGDPLPPGAIARLGTVRFRHGGWVSCLAVAPDGKTVLSGGDDETVRLWDAKTGKEQRRFVAQPPGDKKLYVKSVAFTPDCKTVFTGHFDSFRRWDVASGRQLPAFSDAPNLGHCVAVSADGKVLVAGKNNFIAIWSLDTGRVLRELEQPTDGLEKLVISKDGNYIAAAGFDDTVRWWDARTGKLLHLAKEKGMLAICVDFAPDGKTLVSSGRDNSFRLWDVASGKQLRKWTEHEKWVEAVRFSPDGKLIVSSGMDRTIRFWETNTGKELRRLILKSVVGDDLEFLPDGKTLAAGMSDGVIRFWNVTDGTEIPIAAGMMGRVGSIAFLPDGKSVVSGNGDGVRVWEAETGMEVRKLTGREPRYSYYLAVSPDGQLAASPSFDDPALRIWEIATGKEVGKIDVGKDNAFYGLSFSPDSKTLAAANYLGKLELWDPASAKRVLQIGMGQKYVYCVCFSPNGKTVASATNDDIRLWDAATGKEVRHIETWPWSTFKITFSPDGRVLAAVGSEAGPANKPNYVRLWDAGTGKELPSLHGHEGGALGVAFSPNGRTLASGGGPDKTIRLWELATGKERARLLGHAAGVFSLSFSPDGRRLVSGSGDTTALVWDLTGQEAPGRKPGNLSNAELDALWSDLAGEDATKAWQAVWSLALAPESAVPYLGRRLHPVPAADAAKIARWIADLDADDFATRREAARELETLAELAGPALRKALEANPTQELRRQSTRLLDKLASLSGERLRHVRAVEALDYANTPAARQLLEELARGAPEARLTREAKAVLDRLECRAK